MATEELESEVIDYTAEAKLQFGEVSYAVKSWSLSKDLECSSSTCHVNVTTLELVDYTIKLDRSGFHVLGKGHDNPHPDPGEGFAIFETVYALMDAISPSYAKSFETHLYQKLSANSIKNQ